MSIRRALMASSLVLTAVTRTAAASQIEFIEHAIDTDTHGTGGIYACDIDGDGDVDVLGAGLEDNRIFYWSNSGSNPVEWTRYTIGSNVGSAHSVSAVDIDLNDTLDVIGAAYYGSPGIAWWRNNGGDPIGWSKYPVAPNFINAHQVYTHDLDKDGDADILGASSDLNTISWWRNERGSPVAWTEQTISDDVELAKSVHVGDFDGDGDCDVVGAAITAHDVLWWRNDGGDPIEWTGFLIDGNFLGAHWVQAVDLDKDGDDDVLCAGYLGHQVAWWRNNGGDPVAWTKEVIGTALINACVAIAVDLDADADSDVVVTAQGINSIVWYENDGANPIGWTKHVITDDFVRPWPLYACDLDGDHDIDIVSGSSHQGSNEVKWWENRGTVPAEDSPGLPLRVALGQICPNPFATETTLSYGIPAMGHVRVIVTDALGRQITTLVDKTLPPGYHTAVWDATSVPSGVYFCRLISGSDRRVRPVMVLR